MSHTLLRLLRLAHPILWCLVLALPAWAAESSASSAVQGADQKLFQWYPFLAPFHAVVLHLPIGFLSLAAILELDRMRRPSDELKRVVRMVIWLSLFSGILTAGFGLLRASSGGYEPKAVELHRWFGLAIPLGTLLTLAVQKFAYQSARGSLIFAYRAALVCTLGLLVMGGHLGGNLTHGSGYLVENAPAFMRDLLEPASAATVPPATARNEEQQFYTDNVEPAFKAKCYRCHGPEKQKGGFRLDDPVSAAKGGESGKPAIKPGDVLGSNLARLILLPPDHDDVMPPTGKEPLKPEELMHIIQWIRSGAVFPAVTAGNAPH